MFAPSQPRFSPAAAHAPVAEEPSAEDIFEIPDVSPPEVVEMLDAHIVGQKEAKRAMALVLRNRWRRFRASPHFRDEIHPRNMLMIGPTGVGKTEIARRVSKMTGGPFIKVDLTKYTEVGYQGKQVDSIIEDLYAEAKRHVKERLRKKFATAARAGAEEQVLVALLGNGALSTPGERARWSKLLRDGVLDDTLVDVPLPRKDGSGILTSGGEPPVPSSRPRMTVKEALPKLVDAEVERLMQLEDVDALALRTTEQEGIVFLDEIDKIVAGEGSRGSQVSSEGVQQDLLPIVEGTTVTKGAVSINTSHILFVAGGAFHVSSVKDLLPELQGRFPVRVPLVSLTRDDLRRILVEPKYNLLRQQRELLETEGVTVVFKDCAIDRIADLAYQMNTQQSSLGARRLVTIVENVMSDLSFRAPEFAGTTVTVDRAYVDEHLPKSFLELEEDLEEQIY